MTVRTRRLLAAVAALAVVAAMAVWLAVPALAQTPTATPDATAQPPAGKPELRGGFMFGGGSVAEFDAEAEALGLTPTELFEQLHSGKTLSEIATAQGVDLQAVQNAVSAIRTQSMKDSIAQAVTDGKMSQEHADWLLQGIANGWLDDGGGFGGMGGHTGRGGHGFGRGGQRGTEQPQATPSAQGTQS